MTCHSLAPPDSEWCRLSTSIALHRIVHAEAIKIREELSSGGGGRRNKAYSGSVENRGDPRVETQESKIPGGLAITIVERRGKENYMCL